MRTRGLWRLRVIWIPLLLGMVLAKPGKLAADGACGNICCGYNTICYCYPGYCVCLPGSPILIDLNGDGFQLTNAANGVAFDLGSTGVKVQTAWTTPESDDAFLVLDRNQDGRIDNGSELFGNLTPQPASDDNNGFLALAVFDRPENGGNGDGIIDEHDAIFGKLRVWVDTNHNGISEPSELHTLESVGIKSISLDYREAGRVDRWGNRFRYRSKVSFANGGETWAYDVFFQLGNAGQ